MKGQKSRVPVKVTERAKAFGSRSGRPEAEAAAAMGATRRRTPATPLAQTKVGVKTAAQDKKAKLVAALKRLHPMD